MRGLWPFYLCYSSGKELTAITCTFCVLFSNFCRAVFGLEWWEWVADGICGRIGCRLPSDNSGWDARERIYIGLDFYSCLLVFYIYAFYKVLFLSKLHKRWFSGSWQSVLSNWGKKQSLAKCHNKCFFLLPINIPRC